MLGLVVGVVALVGCRSDPARDRSDNAVNTLLDAKSALLAGEKQVAQQQDKLAALKSGSGDLRPAFNAFRDQIPVLLAEADRLRLETSTVHDQATEFTSNWQRELATIQNQDLRRKARRRAKEVRRTLPAHRRALQRSEHGVLEVFVGAEGSGHLPRERSQLPGVADGATVVRSRAGVGRGAAVEHSHARERTGDDDQRALARPRADAFTAVAAKAGNQRNEPAFAARCDFIAGIAAHSRHVTTFDDAPVESAGRRRAVDASRRVGSETMRAVIFPSPEQITVSDVGEPTCAPDEVIVKIARAGLCGTDVHIWRNEYLSKFPLVPGHEFVGEVVEVGRDVDFVKTGVHVAVDPNIDCGHCDFCRRRQNNQCKNWQGVGITRQGGFAQYVAAPARLAYPVPDDIDDAQAAFIEPLSCVVHAMQRLPMEPGDDVLLLRRSDRAGVDADAQTPRRVAAGRGR
ncbi:MAG: DUF2959 family protein [Chryseolinea sp.]